MPEDIKSFKVGGKVLDIPVSEVDSFLKDVPTAIEIKSFTVGSDTLDIPLPEVDSFLKDVPTAKPLVITPEKKNLLGNESELPAGGNGGIANKPEPAVNGIGGVAGKTVTDWLQNNPLLSGFKDYFRKEQKPIEPVKVEGDSTIQKPTPQVNVTNQEVVDEAKKQFTIIPSQKGGLGYNYNQPYSDVFIKGQPVKKKTNTIVSVGNELYTVPDYNKNKDQIDAELYSTYESTGDVGNSLVQGKVVTPDQSPALYAERSEKFQVDILQDKIIKDVDAYLWNTKKPKESLLLMDDVEKENWIQLYQKQGYTYEAAKAAMDNYINSTKAPFVQKKGMEHYEQKFPDLTTDERTDVIKKDLDFRAKQLFSSKDKEIMDLNKALVEAYKTNGDIEGIKKQLADLGITDDVNMYDYATGKKKWVTSEEDIQYENAVADLMTTMERNVSYEGELQKLYIQKGVEFQELERAFNEADANLRENKWSPETMGASALKDLVGIGPAGESDYEKNQRIRDNIYRQYYDAKVTFDAVSRLYNLNEKPGEKNFGYWANFVGNGLMGGILSEETNNSLVSSTRFQRNKALEQLVANNEVGLPEDVKENIKTTWGEEATMIGTGTVGIATKFWLLNKAAAFSTLPQISNMLRSGEKVSNIKKLSALMLDLYVEELKFGAIGGEPGAGIGFAGAQKLMPDVKFKGKTGALLGPFLNSLYKVDVGMTVAGESSDWFVKTKEAIEKDADVQRYFDENMGGLSDFGRRMSLGFATNWLFGISGVTNKKDWTFRPANLDKAAEEFNARGDDAFKEDNYELAQQYYNDAFQFELKAAIVRQDVNKLQEMVDRSYKMGEDKMAEVINEELQIAQKRKGRGYDLGAEDSKTEKEPPLTQEEILKGMDHARQRKIAYDEESEQFEVDRDNKIEKAQEKLNLITSPLEAIPEENSINNIRKSIDFNTTQAELQDKLDRLYAEHKRILAMKKADTRMFTRSQIDSALGVIETNLRNLSYLIDSKNPPKPVEAVVESKQPFLYPPGQEPKGYKPQQGEAAKPEEPVTESKFSVVRKGKKETVQSRALDNGFEHIQTISSDTKAITSNTIINRGKHEGYDYQITFKADDDGKPLPNSKAVLRFNTRAGTFSPSNIEKEFSFDQAMEALDYMTGKIDQSIRDYKRAERMDINTKFGKPIKFFDRTIQEESDLFNKEGGAVEDKITSVREEINTTQVEISELASKRVNEEERDKLSSLRKKLDDLINEENKLSQEFAAEQNAYDEIIRDEIYDRIMKTNPDIKQDDFYRVRDKIYEEVYENETIPGDEKIKDIVDRVINDWNKPIKDGKAIEPVGPKPEEPGKKTEALESQTEIIESKAKPGNEKEVDETLGEIDNILGDINKELKKIDELEEKGDPEAMGIIKEPWEMDVVEFAGWMINDETTDKASRFYANRELKDNLFPEGGYVHDRRRQIIQQAISEGKQIPSDVLADYPNLIKEKEVQDGSQKEKEEEKLQVTPPPDLTISPEVEKLSDDLKGRFLISKVSDGSFYVIDQSSGNVVRTGKIFTVDDLRRQLEAYQKRNPEEKKGLKKVEEVKPTAKTELRPEVPEAKPVEGQGQENAPTPQPTKPSSPKAKLDTFKKLATGKNRIPILDHVYVKNGIGYASDLEYVVEIKIDLPNGLYEIVGSEYVKRNLSEDEFPIIPVIDKPEFEIKLFDIRGNLERALRMSADDELRPVMSAVHIKSDGKTIRFEGTDAHKLSKNIISGNFPKFDIVIPKEAIELILRNKSAQDFLFKYGKDEEHDLTRVEIDNGDFKIQSRIIDAQYPRIDGFIPEESTLSYKLDKKAFIDAIKQVTPFTDKSTNIIRIKKDPKTNELIVYARDIDRELEKEVRIPVVYKEEYKPINKDNLTIVMPKQIDDFDDKNNETAFDYKILLSGLDNVKGNLVILQRTAKLESIDLRAVIVTTPELLSGVKKEVKVVAPKSRKGTAKKSEDNIQSGIQDKINKTKGDIDDILTDMMDVVSPHIMGETAPKPLENELKLVELGTKLVGKYIELGVYKFADIVSQLVGKLDSAMMEKLLPYLKNAYAAYANEKATDDVFEKMDESRAVRFFTMDKVNKISDQQDIEVAKAQKVDQFTREENFIDDISKRIAESKTPLRKDEIEKIAFEQYGIDNKNRTKELTEVALIRNAREKIASSSNLSDKTIALELVKDYERQPTLSHRTDTSKELQQYSTPMFLSYLMGKYTNADQTNSFEPTAGNGSLVIVANPKDVTANEIDPVRLENLKRSGMGVVLSQDAATEFKDLPQHGSVLTNPPFGPLDKPVMVDGFEIKAKEHLMSIRALQKMHNDGKAALIIGGETEFDNEGVIKGRDRVFFNYLNTNYKIEDIIEVPGEFYSKMGARFPFRVVLINGRKSTHETLAVLKGDFDSAPVKDYNELIDRIINKTTQPHENVLQQPTIEQRGVGADMGRGVTGQPDKSGLEGYGGKGGGKVIEPNQPGDKTGEKPIEPGGEHLGDKTSDKGGTGGIGDVLDEAGRNAANDLPRPEEAGRKKVRGRTFTKGTGPTSKEPDTGNVTDVPNVKELIKSESAFVPYQPVSKGRLAGTVIPAGMAYETNKALLKIEQEAQKQGYLDIDDYVRQKLAYLSLEKLDDALLAEQIDAVAMLINNIDKGQAAIIGDQTGVGKGRVAAAIIRYANQRGSVPIFITQGAGLFTDMYRDLDGIGSADLVPMIVNSQLPNGGKAVVYHPTKRNQAGLPDVLYEFNQKDLDYAIRTGKVPPHVKVVMATYSQFSAGDRPVKRDMLRSLVNGNILIMDESHYASGDETNTNEFFKEIVPMASGTAFLSATWAKRASNFPVYAMTTSVKDANLSTQQLIEAIERGGVAMQEIISSELVNAGQMIRRQRDFTGVEVNYNTIGKEVGTKEDMAKNRYQAEKITELMRDIINFQIEFVDPAIKGIKEQIKRQAKLAGERKGVGELGVGNQPAFSKVFNLVDQMLFAVKAEHVANMVENYVKGNKKIVVAFRNTMESVLDKFNFEAEQEVDIDFNNLLLKALAGTLRYTEKSAGGKPSPKEFLPEELGEEGLDAYNRMINKIRLSPTGVSFSPIDQLITSLEAKGIKVGEITGRKTRVKMATATTGHIIKRDDPSKYEMIDRFNNGDLDVLLINRSAATGLSLHSSKDFKDQRQRGMIIHQFELDINEDMQKRGRIHRYNQVVLPFYDYLSSSVPAEKRLMIMTMQKLKSLDANTTSNQRQSKSMLSEDESKVTDFFNKYGDKLVMEWIKENPAINDMISDPMKLSDPKKDVDDEGAIRKITNRIAILPIDLQEKFYDEMSDRYRDYVKFLKDTNQYDLEIESLPLNAKILNTQVVVKGTGVDSPFGADSEMWKIDADVLKMPMVKADIDKMIDDNLKAANTSNSTDYINGIKDLIDKAYKKRVEIFKKIQQGKEDDQLAELMKKLTSDTEGKTEEEIKKVFNRYRERLDRLYERNSNELLEKINNLESERNNNDYHTVLSSFKPGDAVQIPIDMNQYQLGYSDGIFLGYKLPEFDAEKATNPHKNPFAPSNIKLVFAVGDSRTTITPESSRRQFLDMIIARTHSLGTGQKDEIIQNWDTRTKIKGRETRYVVVGNILQGFATYKGNLIKFNTEDGRILPGILMSKAYNPAKKIRIPTPPLQLEDHFGWLPPGEFVHSEDGLISLGKEPNYYARDFVIGENRYIIRVPESTKEGSKFYENRKIKAISSAYEWNKKGPQMERFIPKENIRDLLEILQNDLGTKFIIEKEEQLFKEQKEEKQKKLEDSEGFAAPERNYDGRERDAYWNESDSEAELNNELLTEDSPAVEHLGNKRKSMKAKYPRLPIAPIPITQGEPTKKIAEILSNFSKDIQRTFFYDKHPSGKGRSAGASWTPWSMTIKTKEPDNMDYIAHEVGHMMDDMYGVLGKWKDQAESPFDEELKPFWIHGSKPPRKLSPEQRKTYMRAEGVAEWLRAYIVNPEAAERMAPQFSHYFKNEIAQTALKSIEKFSQDVRKWGGASASDQVLSHYEDLDIFKQHPPFQFKKWGGWSHDEDNFGFTIFDRVKYYASDQYQYAKKAYEYAVKMRGFTDNIDILPDDNFKILLSLFSNVGGKADRMMRLGLKDRFNNWVQDPETGQKMNLEYLIGAFDSNGKKEMLDDMLMTIALTASERTLELRAKKLKGQGRIAGFGAGILKEELIAEGVIKQLEEVAKTDPDRFERITESARRYRNWADANLRYLVESDRLSENQYQKIKERNEFYVSFQRLNEISPDEELVIYKSSRGGGIGYTDEVVRGIRGSVKRFKNPYHSLIESTYRSIREGDRNRVIKSFVDQFVEQRGMYDGMLTSKELSRFAHPIEKGMGAKLAPDEIAVFENGKKVTWWLNPDIAKTFKNMRGMDETLQKIINVLSFMPQVMRKSITHSPLFPIINTMRDTTNRLVISSTNFEPLNGIGDMLPSKFVKMFGIDKPVTTKELRDYGGDMAGFLYKDKFNYHRLLRQTMVHEIDKGKSIIVDPMKLIRLGSEGYIKYVESGETANRLAEFRSAFKYAKKEFNLDDHNAMLYAAYKSRELIDFAVMGKAMTFINRFMPFTNAAIQGIKAAWRSAKNDPAMFTVKFAAYLVTPCMIEYAMAIANNYDDELRQQPSYMRDMYWNFKIGPDLWVRIPKPFELGVAASLFGRSMDYFYMQDKNAFQDYYKSMYNAFQPFDETNVFANPATLKGLGEAFGFNRDLFRNTEVVPSDQFELSGAKIMELGYDKRASRLGKVPGWVLNQLNDDWGVDARKIDHVIKAQFTYFGEYAMRLSDIGREDKKGQKSTLKAMSFFQSTPVYRARDVQWVLDFAKSNGLVNPFGYSSDPQYNFLMELVHDYWDATTAEEKEAIGKDVVNLAKEIREDWELLMD